MMTDKTGIAASPRFRAYSDEMRQLFGELSAVFCDCQRTFAAIIDVNPEGPAADSAAELEHEHLRHDPPYPSRAPSLVPMTSYFYLSTAAEHMGGLGALYAAEEVAYPPPLLIRAVVEHAARVVWLLDNEIDVRDRLARAYLDELFSHVEYKKTIGRLAGKQSDEYKQAGEALKDLRKEAEDAFGEKVVDEAGVHRIRGASMPGLEDCVASLISKLMADAPIPDARGVYDLVSNLCHPTSYTHAERWKVVDHEGKQSLASNVGATDHDRPARLAMAAFCEAVKHLVSYNEWEHTQLDALMDRLPTSS
jgi:hypothetical protein